MLANGKKISVVWAPRAVAVLLVAALLAAAAILCAAAPSKAFGLTMTSNIGTPQYGDAIEKPTFTIVADAGDPYSYGACVSYWGDWYLVSSGGYTKATGTFDVGTYVYVLTVDEFWCSDKDLPDLTLTVDGVKWVDRREGMTGWYGEADDGEWETHVIGDFYSPAFEVPSTVPGEPASVMKLAATSNLAASSLATTKPKAGATAKAPTFTISEINGTQVSEAQMVGVRFVTSQGGWYNSKGTKVSTFDFVSSYYYKTQIRIEGTALARYRFAENATVTVDGVAWSVISCENTGSCSLLWVKSPAYKTKKNIAAKTVKLSYSAAACVNQPRQPKVTIDGLTQGVSYKVSYQNNVKVGTATVVITGMGNYQGTITKTFKVVPRKAHISSAAAGVGKVTLVMEQKAAWYHGTNFQIAFRVKGSTAWKYMNTVHRTKDVAGLTKGKMYELKVRAYKVIDGVKYVGTWSEVVTSAKVK